MNSLIVIINIIPQKNKNNLKFGGANAGFRPLFTSVNFYGAANSFMKINYQKIRKKKGAVPEGRAPEWIGFSPSVLLPRYMPRDFDEHLGEHPASDRLFILVRQVECAKKALKASTLPLPFRFIARLPLPVGDVASTKEKLHRVIGPSTSSKAKSGAVNFC